MDKLTSAITTIFSFLKYLKIVVRDLKEPGVTEAKAKPKHSRKREKVAVA